VKQPGGMEMNEFDMDEMLKMFEEIDEMGGVTLECGCFVEPDGICPCGNESPLLAMGMI
jgi:hypothetical protein